MREGIVTQKTNAGTISVYRSFSEKKKEPKKPIKNLGEGNLTRESRLPEKKVKLKKRGNRKSLQGGGITSSRPHVRTKGGLAGGENRKKVGETPSGECKKKEP